jgi:1,4-dihydroxy-2-naphthoate polyprenyltransferase
LYTALVYTMAMGVMGWHFFIQLEATKFLLLATCMLPILVYFLVWAVRVWKNQRAADYSHTMRMNILASVCTNTGFLIILIWNIFE